MCRCLYNINDFHCRQTKAELCFDMLAKKFLRPNITMPTHRELFPECAKYINEKDPGHYGPKASALLDEVKEHVQSEPPKFRDHLPVIKFPLWKTFIDENRSDPFQLAGYLNERWREKKINWEELTNKNQRNLVENVTKMIEYFTAVYASQDNFDIIRSLLDEISKDIQILNIGYEKEAVEKNINRWLRDRAWSQLHQLSITARKDYFPLEFINYLSAIETLAEGGMNYLDTKSKLDQLVNEKNTSDPLSILGECIKMKNKLFFLFSNIEKFEKKEKIDEPQQLSEEIYKKLLAQVKEIPGPEEKYRMLNRFEEELDGILPHRPEEWGIYKSALEKDISALYRERLDDILKNTESLPEIEAAVNGLENRVRQNTDILYSILHFDSVKRTLEKMSGHLKTMDRFLEYENPWIVIQQNKLINHLETSIELLKPTVREWACFNSLETKFKFTTDVSTKTREILEKINAFLDSVKSESHKILHFDLSLNIEQYQPNIDIIIEKTSELPRLYKKIRFLTNLEEITLELKQIIFPASPPPPGFINEKDKSLIPSIKEEVEKGDKIYEAFKTLHAKSFDEPLKLIDEFIAIMQKNRGRGFILRSGLDRSVVETIGKIRRSIFDKMNDILFPMAEVLKRVYPLPSPDELKTFKMKIESIKKKHSEINTYYQACGILINPHQQQLKEIDKLIEAEELILRKKSGEAAEIIYRSCSFDYPVQNQLRMVNYYYEKIHRLPWDEVTWRSFFNKYFEALADKGTQLKYREILEEYGTSLVENFIRLQPDCLEEHYKILNRHLKENHMLPYIIYITDNCDVKNLCRTIHEKESVKNLFPLFLDYLVHYCMWPKYAELYKSIDASQQEMFGGSPLKLPREDLEKRYHEIKNVFLQTLTISPRLEESGCLIPPGEEFAEIKGKFKHLSERMEDFKNINHTFETYKSINIWINDRFITDLNQLKSMCSKFSHQWTPIRMQMRWEETIQTLKKIYGKGRDLMKKFNLASEPEAQGIDFLENVETKAAVRYSEQLEFFLNQILELWQDFNTSARELTGETQTSELKNVFNQENHKRFKEKWQTLEFHRLWVREKLPEPGNLDQFFDMFQQVLDNHKKFREWYRDETVAEHLNKFKTLDPFINLMLDNLVERGLIKSRGAR